MKNLFIFTFSCASTIVVAQENYRITQYSSNPVIYNNSILVHKDMNEFTALYRKQWSIVNFSPETFFVSGSGKVNQSNLYVSGFMVLDKISIYNRNQGLLSLGYKLKLNSDNFFSASLAGGFNSENVDLSRAVYAQGDNTILSGFNNRLSPIVNIGFSYFNSKLGILAAPSFVDVTANQNLNMYLGWIKTLSKKGDISVSALYKHSLVSSRDNIDFNVIYEYNKRIGVGIGYRETNELLFNVRLFPIPNLCIGYSYDYGLGNLTNMNGHEVYLRYGFASKLRISKIKTGYSIPFI